LEKGRLKTNKVSFAKTSEAGFQTTSTVEAGGGSSMVSGCLAIGWTV
jgi:hypothetical protein